MNLKKSGIGITSLIVLILLTSTNWLLLSCGKNEPSPTVEPPTLPPVDPDEDKSKQELFYKLIRVNNLQGTDKNDFENAAPNIYYSLETNKMITADHLQTRNWDLAFGGLMNSFISANNGKDSKNYGAGNTATGGILIVEKEFDEVVDIPNDSEFHTEKDRYGTDNFGGFGQGVGWYLYDFNGDILRDGSKPFQHVVYPMNKPWKLNDGKITPPRTTVIRTAKGSYAKLRILSLYKDRLDSTGWRRDAPKVFFTFEYVMVPKGSKKFEIKK